jgi:prenyl protein peptidase
MCPLLFTAGFSPGACVGLAALVFGCAHLHHRLDMRSQWLIVLVQFTYTSLFGAYSAYLYMRTGHLLPPLVAHAFCNLMGLPDFGAIEHAPRPWLVRCLFALGLCGFGALAAADALWRPRLFGSVLWDELG